MNRGTAQVQSKQDKSFVSLIEIGGFYLKFLVRISEKKFLKKFLHHNIHYMALQYSAASLNGNKVAIIFFLI